MLSPITMFPLASGASIALSILGIGFLIFVHELGHYLACRLTKTRVETFSIGFGTRLFGWEHLPGEPRRLTIGRRRLDAAQHAMDFRVALVPLGGYVKMAGENIGEDRTGAPDEFPSKPMMARVFIVSAGVIMNVIAAWALYFVAFAGHMEQEPAIAGAVSTGGPAWEAGMEAGDRVKSLDGSRLRSFLQLKMETVFLGVDGKVPAVVDRNGEEVELQVQPRYYPTVGAILLKILPPRTLLVEQEGKTTRIGPRDRVKVDGVPATGGSAMTRLLSAALALDEESSAEVEMPSGESVTLRFQPVPREGKPVYKIGIEPFVQPVVRSVRRTARGRFEPGDRLLAAKGAGSRIGIESASDLERLPWSAPITAIEVTRGDETLDVAIDGATPAALHAALSDLAFDTEPTVASRPLQPGALSIGPEGNFLRYPSVPSLAAGLRAGDRIVRVGTIDIDSWDEIVRAVGTVTSPDPLPITVVGVDEERRILEITPVALERLAGPALSVEPYMEPFESDGILDAAGAAFSRTGREIKGIFRLIGAFFSGRLSFGKNVGGPVTIVTVSSKTAERSGLQFLAFLAYISVTLAVLNILPIPILDGGHLLFILIEKIKGSPLKEETMGKLQFVGLMMLLVLMFFAFKNDFSLITR